MKKLLCFVVVLLLAITVFAACGETETTTPTNTTNPEVNTTTTPTADVTTTIPKTDSTTVPQGETTTRKPVETFTPAVISTVPKLNIPEPEVTTEPPVIVPEMAEDAVDIDGILYGDDAIEYHGGLDYNPALVFCLDEETTYLDVLGTLEEIDGEAYWNNPAYSIIIELDGKNIAVKRVNVWDGGSWGYLRCELGTDAIFESYERTDGAIQLSYTVYIIDVAANNVKYYYSREMTFQLEVIEDTTKPDGITAVEGVTCVTGPNMGDGEGADKAFDGFVQTKLCTDDNGAEHAIKVNLGGEKSLKGISLVNANDNEDNNGRTVTSFEVWVSVDGENWGDAAAWSTTGEGVDKSEISQNFIERYYGFDTEITATYVKLVINNGEMYQFSEVIFYQ